jgi:PhnB protein
LVELGIVSHFAEVGSSHQTSRRLSSHALALLISSGRCFLSHNLRRFVMSVKAIPDGYHSVTPYLIVSDAARALEFYKQAFGAVELMRLDGPNGKVMHAEVKIGDSPVMLADEFPEMDAISPQTLKGTPVSLMIYVEDVDARFKQAVTAGAKVQREVQDQFYGDRSGTLVDPFGHVWSLATHVEDVTMEQVKERLAQMMKQSPEC